MKMCAGTPIVITRTMQIDMPSTLVRALLEAAFLHHITMRAAGWQDHLYDEKEGKRAHGANVPDVQGADQRIKRKASPSKSPRSLNFRWGITSSAMKESVMYGAVSVLPSAFASRSKVAYASATVHASPSDINPAIGNGSTRW